jgi:ketosteroid isomerase-like protein
MSDENVELFRRFTRQWQEERRIAAEHLTDDVEWVNPQDAVEGGSRHGPAGFNEAIGAIFEGWDESRFEVERVVGKGDDVIALGQLRTRSGTDLELTRPHGQIWTFRDGRVARMRWFQSHAETLEAGGLGD